MIWLILGIMATCALFVALGLDIDDSGYHTKVGFKLNRKQFLSLICLLICIPGFVGSVPANHVGIVYSPFGGTKEETLGEGIVIKNPLDKIYKISTEDQTTTIEKLTTQTKDAQYLTSVLDVKYKVNESNAYLVFKQYRTLENMSNSLIAPTTQRVLELITTKYNVIDILGEKRSDIYSELEMELAKEFKKYGVQFRSISITDMDAGAELEAAITAEAVAKKEVETAEQNLQKAQKDKERKIVEAQAEKEANELLDQSLSEKVIQQMWIEKWNGQMPTYYGGDANLMIGAE